MITRFNLRLAEFLLPGHLEGLQTQDFKTTYLSEDTLRMWLRAPTVDTTQLCGIDIETYPAPGWEDKAGAAIHSYSARIRCVQIYDGKEVIVLDFMLPDGSNLLHTDKTVLGQFCNLLTLGTWTAHNAQFEVNHFTRLLEMNGSPTELTVYCTMNAYRLILQADSWDWKKYDASLKGVSRRVLGVNVDKEISHAAWAVPGKFDQEQLRYCTLDAVLPKLLLAVLFENISGLGMTDYFKLNTRLHNVIAHMTLFGSPIDADLHAKLITEWEVEFDKAAVECFDLLNCDRGFTHIEEFNTFIVDKVTSKQVQPVMAFVELFMWGKDVGDSGDLLELQHALEQRAVECVEDASAQRAFKRAAKNIEEYLINPGSDKQLSEWAKAHVPQEVLDDWALTDASIKYVDECKTKGVEIDPAKVQLKMDAETFDDLGELEVIGPISRYKKYSKLLSTYGETLQNYYVHNPWSDRPTVHAQFSLCYTETGRLSTYKPSCHQIPRQKKGTVGLRSCFIPHSDDHEFVSADLCFTGDTLIDTPNGDTPIRDLSVGDLVFTYRKDRPAVGKVTQHLLVGKEPCVEVWLDNGKKIRCTKEHKFLLTDCSKVQAGDLKPGDRLLPIRRTNAGHGYTLLYSHSSFRYVKEHNVVAEAAYGKRPEGFHVHHIDGDRANNAPYNLEYKEASKHWSDHGKENYKKQNHTLRIKELRKALKNRRTYVGKENPNWGKFKSDPIKCLYCKKKFRSPPSHNAKYCSVACYQESRQLGLNCKVVSVTEISGLHNVYSIAVSPDKNYALSAGVFVSNSQIELRADAEITGDPVMLEVYETGGDIHATTAAGILAKSGLTKETVNEADWEITRDASKNVNFACVYGGGAGAVKKGGRKSGIKYPLDVWQTFVDAYRDTYSVARQYKLEHADYCKKTLKVTVPYGKVCALHPDWAFTQSLNFPVQGSAFVVLAIGLCGLYRVYCDRGDLQFKILKTVHDSIDISCHESQVEELKHIITSCFEHGMLTVFPEATTLNLVGIKSGASWS